MVSAMAASRPSIGDLWRTLACIPDPEIPAISIVDLGIVRSVEWSVDDAAMAVVRLTPTYAGCPATDAIADAVRDALHDLGIGRVRIETALSPPWSTAWITPEGQRQLREHGIVPPGAARPGEAAPVEVAGISPLRRRSAAVPCPRCGSMRTRLVAQFGSTACKAQYRCLDCLEPFDFFKPLE
jgi:ring-1,2-phenylacetyl-CoA epoxidase subunit PaaD